MRGRRLPEGALPLSITLPTDQGVDIPEEMFGR